MTTSQDDHSDNAGEANVNRPVCDSVQEGQPCTDADYEREFRLEIATSYLTLSLLVMLFNIFPLGIVRK